MISKRTAFDEVDKLRKQLNENASVALFDLGVLILRICFNIRKMVHGIQKNLGIKDYEPKIRDKKEGEIE